MPTPVFSVEDFNIQRLIALLSEKSLASPTVVKQKLHSTYFDNYFQEVKPATIIVENDYVDHDYLEDHAGFYDRCFYPYKRKCTRIHFFGAKFSENDFRQLLRGVRGGVSLEQMQESYQGFVVVKWLPRGIIGRTCLKPYPLLDGQRQYPIVRIYRVNLFGLDLSVESLAFQEQDSVVAACATSALWSVFQGTGLLFGHATPSPVEITRIATLLTSEGVPRAMPNKGLTGSQIINAMLKVGLAPLRFSASDPWILKATAYAYLRARIPLLLVLGLHDVSADSGKRLYNYYRHKHAVAITGFRIDDDAAESVGDWDFKLRASRMQKLYVHDDGVGPFSRMVFDGKKITVMDALPPLDSMMTSWRGGDGVIGHTRAVPEILFVPLNAKIRVDFEFVQQVILGFDALIKQCLQPVNLDKLCEEFEWDLFLTQINELKREILGSPFLDQSTKETLVLEPWPKYIWRCVLRKNNEMLLELLFDATDIEGGKFFLRAIAYDTGYYPLIAYTASILAGRSDLPGHSSWPILSWFRDNQNL